MARPLCFVVMPFGQKPADAGALIDFNAVYHNLIKAAITALSNTLANVRESWEPQTTAHNLRLIRVAREKRGKQPDWATQAEQALEARSGV